MRPVNNCTAFAVYLTLCRWLRLTPSAVNFLAFCRSGYDLLALDWPRRGEEELPCTSAL